MANSAIPVAYVYQAGWMVREAAAKAAGETWPPNVLSKGERRKLSATAKREGKQGGLDHLPTALDWVAHDRWMGPHQPGFDHHLVDYNHAIDKFVAGAVSAAQRDGDPQSISPKQLAQMGGGVLAFTLLAREIRDRNGG